MENSPQENKAATPPEAPKKQTVKTVTSDVDVDFPSLGWAISAGIPTALPEDETAQKTILENHHIKLTNQ